LQESLEYHDQHEKSFSNLMRTRFDDVLTYSGNETIDLLRIDGCHLYESVQHDCESLVPKSEARGIVLLYDASVQEEGLMEDVFLLTKPLRWLRRVLRHHASAESPFIKDS
jgi:hypothetical protein